jgi:hypothetical protein
MTTFDTAIPNAYFSVSEEMLYGLYSTLDAEGTEYHWHEVLQGMFATGKFGVEPLEFDKYYQWDNLDIISNFEDRLLEVDFTLSQIFVVHGTDLSKVDAFSCALKIHKGSKIFYVALAAESGSARLLVSDSECVDWLVRTLFVPSLVVKSRPLLHRKSSINLITSDLDGYLSDFPITLGKDVFTEQGLRILYGDLVQEFQESFDRYQTGIWLLDGEPGTGKTTLIKTLCPRLNTLENVYQRESNIYYLPPHLIEKLDDPSMIEHWLRMCKGAVLIVEDAESSLSQSEGVRLRATSALLNASDGILKDAYGFRFILTANKHFEIDPALTRSGRLRKHVTIPPVSKETAQAYYDYLVSREPERYNAQVRSEFELKLLSNPSDSLTVAELYGYLD